MSKKLNREEFGFNGFKYISYNLPPENTDFSNPTVFLGGAFHSVSSLTKHQLVFAQSEDVYWLELPGQGEADFLPSSHGFDFLATCLNDFLASKGIDRCNLIASSYSTPIAIAFSAGFPEKISSLVLAGTARSVRDDVREILLKGIELSYSGGEAFADACIDTLFNLNASKEIPIQRRIVPPMKKFASVLDEQSRRVFRHNTRRLFDAVVDHQSIPLCPLIMTGEFDTFTTLDDGFDVASLYSDSQVVIVEKADHMMPIENPRAVWSAASRWVNSGCIDSIGGITMAVNH